MLKSMEDLKVIFYFLYLLFLSQVSKLSRFKDFLLKYSAKQSTKLNPELSSVPLRRHISSFMHLLSKSTVSCKGTSKVMCEVENASILGRQEVLIKARKRSFFAHHSLDLGNSTVISAPKSCSSWLRGHTSFEDIPKVF